MHHVGRTGRAGQAGLAVSLVSTDAQAVPIGGPHQRAVLHEEHFLEAVEALTGQRVERRKVPGPWRDVDRHCLDDTLAEGSPGEGQVRAGVTEKGWEGLGRSGRHPGPERSGEVRASAGRSSGRNEHGGALVGGGQQRSDAAESSWGRNGKEERLGRASARCLEGAALGDSGALPGVTVADVVEGMERGLARRAGIKRLRDIEKKPRGRRRRSGKAPLKGAPSG